MPYSFQPGLYPINIVRNDTFYENIQVRDTQNIPVDFSEYTFAKMMVKENENTESLVTFSSTGSTNFIDISNLSAGQIIISGSSFNINPGRYFYDVELRNNIHKETIISDSITVAYDYTV